MQLKDRDDRALVEHILTSLRSVFNRPRFKMRAEIVDNQIHIRRDDRLFKLSVGTDFLRVSIYVMFEGDEPKAFYRNEFSRDPLPPMWKIGVTIANKIIQQPIHEVHSV